MRSNIVWCRNFGDLFFFFAFDSFICRNAYVTKWWLIVWQYDSNKSVIDGMTTACSTDSTNRQIWENRNPKSTCVQRYAYIAYALSSDIDEDGNGFYRHSRRLHSSAIKGKKKIRQIRHTLISKFPCQISIQLPLTESIDRIWKSEEKQNPNSLH